jgi:signal transduction histidine kinase
VTRAIGAKGCALLLLTPAKDQLLHIADYGLSGAYVQKGPVRTSPILAEVLEGKNVLVVDVSADPRVVYREEAIREGIASMLSVPVMLGKELVGVLRIYTSQHRIYSIDEIDFLGAVAHLGALALDRARAHEATAEAYEQQIREKTRELSNLEEGRKELLRLMYVAGHDLKAPLAAIESYMAVLLGGYAGELPENVRNIIERSSLRAMQMIELISDIMDVSRLEARQLIWEMKETHLEPVIKDSLEVVASEAAQKGIELKQQIPQPLPKVQGDQVRLQQVLTNLLVNAVRYTPSGGSVTLRVEEKPREVLFEVVDTGIGILPQEMPRIFEEFFRGSNVEAMGTGLGLAIVKKIVEAHGGKVWAESPCPETGQGSKFNLVLPRRG